jgi:1,4-dihydroxy-2-naphthoate octaprenyltransferase
MDYLTLRKSDSEIRQFLNASSTSFRYLPVSSLNWSFSGDFVTFRKVAVSDIVRPPLWKVLAILVRFEWLPLSLAPMLVTGALASLQTNGMKGLAFGISIVSVICLQWGSFALNDYFDFHSGRDRLRSSGGSQVIERGWLSPWQVAKFAVIFLIVGGSLGLTLLWHQPQLMALAGGGVAISILAYSFLKRTSFAFNVSDLLIFLCFGPLLTTSLYQVVTSQSPPGECFLLGAGYGLLAVVCWHGRQLENILRDGRQRTQGSIVRWGLDKGKQLLAGQLFLSLAVWLFLIWHLNFHLWIGLGFASVLLFTHGAVFMRLHKIVSPLSSQLFCLRKQLLRVHITVTAMLLLDLLFL